MIQIVSRVNSEQDRRQLDNHAIFRRNCVHTRHKAEHFLDDFYRIDFNFCMAVGRAVCCLLKVLCYFVCLKAGVIRRKSPAGTLYSWNGVE